jgi:hypothetical protein
VGAWVEIVFFGIRLCDRLIYTSPSLGRMSASAADRVVLSHPNRGMYCQSDALIVPSHRDEAPAPLTWEDRARGLRTCLMIGETASRGNCLT